MIEIKTNEGSILVVDDDKILRSITKGSQTVAERNGYVKLSLAGAAINYDLKADTKVDGESFADATALANKLSSFKRGGGDGGGGVAGVQSVTGDLVDNTDPKNPVINSPEIPVVTGIPKSYISGGNHYLDHERVMSFKGMEWYDPIGEVMRNSSSGGGILMDQKPPGEWYFMGPAGGGGWRLYEKNIDELPYAGEARRLLDSSGTPNGRFCSAWFTKPDGYFRRGRIMENKFLYEERDTTVGNYTLNASAKKVTVDLKDWVPPFVSRSATLPLIIEHSETVPFKILINTYYNYSNGGAVVATEYNKGLVIVPDMGLNFNTPQKFDLVIEGDPVGDINIRVHCADYTFER